MYLTVAIVRFILSFPCYLSIMSFLGSSTLRANAVSGPSTKHRDSFVGLDDYSAAWGKWENNNTRLRQKWRLYSYVRERERVATHR